MKREEYLRSEILRHTYYWVNTILILGIFLFLFLGLMDYYVAPKQFPQFFLLRNAIAVILLGMLVFNKLLSRERIRLWLQYSIIFVGTALAAATIEIMILELGGHQSFYYAGLILLAICVLSFVPLNLLTSTACVVTIYLIYVIPIFLFDTLTDKPIFIAHNAFLISTFIAVLVGRYLAQKNLVRTLSLQYDLDRDHRKLEVYSTDLEHLVEERTQMLGRSESMLRSLFENASDGVAILDSRGTILEANEQAAKLHGFDRSSFVGKNLEFFESEENRISYRERMQRILRGETLLFETQRFAQDGSRVWLEASAKAVQWEGETRVLVFYRDLTEKKKIQDHLSHSQKMDSIGMLAGGIAHDFNNVLSGILGNMELILASPHASNDILERGRTIESTALSAAALVSKLMGFARREQVEPVPFDLNKLTEASLDMLSRLLGSRTRLVRELHENLPMIRGDSSQIEQVIMNLVLNANDAMPDGGQIIVRTDFLNLGPNDIDIGANVTEGTYVRLSVEDSGSGIPEEHLKHIFEPFYTTKAKGKGTGLGLAMVYGILKDHGGYITVENRLGGGAIFTLYLPAVPSRVPEKFSPADALLTRGKNVLVIDDETSVLKFVKETLEAQGFQVMVCDNALQGLNLYRKNAENLDLVITDMYMPYMDGQQLISRIRDASPEMPIIAITGFHSKDQTKEADDVLEKPFSTVQLLSSIRKNLPPRG